MNAIKDRYFPKTQDNVSLLDTVFNLIGTSYIVLNSNEYLKHESINPVPQVHPLENLKPARISGC